MKAALVLLLAPALAAAEGAALSFLAIPSARSAAMGETSVVSADGAHSLAGNPGNISRLASPHEASASFLSLLDGARYTQAAYVRNFHPFLAAPRMGSKNYPAGRVQIAQVPWGAFSPAAVGLSVSQYAVPGLEGRDDAGNRTGDFAVRHTAATLAAAVQPRPGWGAGVAGKWVGSRIADASASALLLDAGVMYAPAGVGPGFSIGAAVTNVGRGPSYLNSRSPLPSAAALGATWRLGRALWALQVDRMFSGPWAARAGLEFGDGPFVARAGYRAESGGRASAVLKAQDATRRLTEGLSLGFGLRRSRWTLDYALSQRPVEWGMAHHFSLSWRWGEHALPPVDLR